MLSPTGQFELGNPSPLDEISGGRPAYSTIVWDRPAAPSFLHLPSPSDDDWVLPAYDLETLDNSSTGSKSFDDWTVPMSNDEEGDKFDDIVVVGERPPADRPDYDPNPGGGGDGGIGQPGGSGGGPPQAPPDRPHDACEDRAADTLADDINDEIVRQPDSNRREYGALIWRDDAGNLHRTALVPGTNGNVPFPADPNQLGLDSYSRVVGIVHSHPSEVNVGTDASPNWVPASEGFIHGGDWRAMDGWVSQNNLSVNNFTVYISYQGQIREYDYADNLDPNLRSAQDSAGSQESGDYNPGATCP